MLTQTEQRRAAKEFANKWKGIGYEKGDSARFWISLLNEVYGVQYPGDFIRFEDRVKLDNTSFIDGYISSTHVLIEQKGIDKDLRKSIRQSDGSHLSPFQQAKRYSAELPYSERPRWIVTSNFKEFHIYDMEKPSEEPEVVLLSDLENDYYRMFFLVDQGDKNIQKEMEVSLQAGELVGVLYDALLKQYQNPNVEQTLKDLNILCVRLVFCLYAEDAGLFGKHGMFHDYLVKYNDYNFRDALIKLFRVLDQKPEERDPYLELDLASFPYVNGGLFENENVVIPKINKEIIDIILNQASSNFDWSKISPTIFGAVFESTLNPESRRSGGMHYTSIENIHKVIDPLFLNELYEEFEEIKMIKVERTRNKRLDEFQVILSNLQFLDPAAGSGNFLTETYISLRRLENKVLMLRLGSQIVLGDVINPIKVSIGQFYGIEINDFAVTVAKTALWIAESQMIKETEDIVHANIEFLPLKSYANIIEGNALRVNWEEIVGKEKLDYIMGNPPFIGHQNRDKAQQDEMNLIFAENGFKKLDYVCAWYIKAIELIKDSSIKVAFVSTNSIVQGEQAVLMTKLFIQFNIEIIFGYRSFVWMSEAKDRAAVHCIIMGFTKKIVPKGKKLIFDNLRYKEVDYINNYLLEAPDVVLESRGEPPVGIIKMTKGSQPTDGGNLIFNENEYNALIEKYPQSTCLFKQYVGAEDFIKGKYRYCLWLVDIPPNEYIKISEIKDRLVSVVVMRKESPTKSVNEMANVPYLFTQIRQPSIGYLLIPRVSSERRKYIPIGYVSEDVIASDSTQLIASEDKYLFGILTSNMHNAWMRVVAGRLKSDYRYSPFVYNNFPWILDIDIIHRQRIEYTAKKILEARAIYDKRTLAELYDPLVMPPELIKAHQENDKAVMEAYGFDWRKMTESECVAELMKMYKELNGK